MKQQKQFTLGAVLTVTTGRLLCPIGEAYSILSHMTGESLMTHQLSRALAACKPVLRERFPALADIDPGDLRGEAAILAWLEVQQGVYGNEFDVDAGVEAWETIDPITELEQKLGGASVPIVVVSG